MEPIDSLNQVAEFHRTFKHPILSNPTVPNEDRCKLRIALLAEELKELEVGIINKDIVEIADALCDLQYVLSGAVLEFGLGDKFKALFDEVQRSNMSKTCSTEEIAQKTVEHYEAKGFPCYYVKSENHFLVFRKEDNKTLKSIEYSEADLSSIINK
jgi:predicted HAD superfamily Cof-like phosphohydrolase